LVNRGHWSDGNSTTAAVSTVAVSRGFRSVRNEVACVSSKVEPNPSDLPTRTYDGALETAAHSLHDVLSDDLTLGIAWEERIFLR
jgi:non-canonical (house-cleaning) NTP pyrophosphatase